jgi:hypothetical protein
LTGILGIYWGFIEISQLEIKSGNPLKISGKGGTSGKHRRKKSGMSGFPSFISNWVYTRFLAQF